VLSHCLAYNSLGARSLSNSALRKIPFVNFSHLLNGHCKFQKGLPCSMTFCKLGEPGRENTKMWAVAVMSPVPQCWLTLTTHHWREVANICDSTVSIFRCYKILTISCRTTVRFSETLVSTYNSIWCENPDEWHLHPHHNENLESHNFLCWNCIKCYWYTTMSHNLFPCM
jgi:hypothetical protein